MHQRLKRPGHETVVDEEIFIDAQLRIATFEIASMVILHAMAQNQVLRAGWSANRIGLYKAHPMERALERSWWKQTPGDRMPPQVVNGDRHSEMLSKSGASENDVVRTEQNPTHPLVIPNRSEGPVRNLLSPALYREPRPRLPPTVIVTNVFPTLPQLSQDCTTVLYVAGERVIEGFRLEASTL